MNSGLFVELPHDGLFWGFPRVDSAAWKNVKVFVSGSCDEEEVVLVVFDQAVDAAAVAVGVVGPRGGRFVLELFGF